MGRGGETLFLDMGEPVRIGDLAQNQVRLSGLEPDRDVPIEMVGLRTGERLREELVMEKEELIASGHEKVFMKQNHHFDPEVFRCDIEKLRLLMAARDREGAVAHLNNMAVRY